MCRLWLGISSLPRPSVLAQYRPNLEVLDSEGLTPLAWEDTKTISKGTLKLLVREGLDVDTNASPGRSLRLDACSTTRFDLGLTLLGLSAASPGTAALHCCCKTTMNLPYITTKQSPHFTSLESSATLDGAVQLTKTLMQAGDGVDADKERNTPLIIASWSCLFPVVEAFAVRLPWHEVNPNANTMFNVTPLSIVCGLSVRDPSKTVVALLLIMHGVRLDEDDYIYKVFLAGEVGICQMLLGRGARVPSQPNLMVMARVAVDCKRVVAVRYGYHGTTVPRDYNEGDSNVAKARSCKIYNISSRL
ncbi:uncharacterized protein BCR38DRAFT_404700 [Pseudomassariella vexata]|uniref:Ankyrin repeat-containing domain protein n=1 Tax=Pseudomassariella vexata TaxID=1141098 RepID=A0A1Y2EJH8_9PEZI|nr:uncharacterized protein BCR38DRAFT_404700 [Pseudomassariella vexata]ORY71637.1 hypothetical protein BCR38DRAFT_404700 [Pseudomassariella vexata]